MTFSLTLQARLPSKPQTGTEVVNEYGGGCRSFSQNYWETKKQRLDDFLVDVFIASSAMCHVLIWRRHWFLTSPFGHVLEMSNQESPQNEETKDDSIEN